MTQTKQPPGFPERFIRQVNLRVNTRNQSAVALYLKLGFVQFGLEHDSLLINGEYHDEYEMAYVVRSEA